MLCLARCLNRLVKCTDTVGLATGLLGRHLLELLLSGLKNRSHWKEVSNYRSNAARYFF
jgi:hypothetical protein